MKTPYLVWMLFLIILTACAPLAPQSTGDTPVNISSIDDAAVRAAYADMLSKFPAYENTTLQAYVRGVGNRLVVQAPHTDLPIHFTVLDSPGSFAYSFGFGEIVISRGLMAYLNTEAQLAAVLAHEIGHVVSQHQAQSMREYGKTRELAERLSKRFTTVQAKDMVATLGLAKLRGYSREHELEADQWSERLLLKTGYPPAAMSQVLRFFVQEERFFKEVGGEMWELPDGDDSLYYGVFATHPSPDLRLEQAARRIGPAANQQATPDPAYLDALRGLIVGLPAQAGIVRGNTYQNPARGFAWTLAPGWYMFNVGEHLFAASRDSDALVSIRLQTEKPQVDAESEVRAYAAGRPQRDPRAIGTSPRDGASSRIQSRDGRSMRVGVIDVGAQRLIFLGQTRDEHEFDQTDSVFIALMQSVRTLSMTERDSVAPLHLETDEIDLSSLDQELFPDHPRERWALLNQLYPDKALPPGSRAKTIR
jgi:predicted Zn-dependent protease